MFPAIEMILWLPGGTSLNDYLYNYSYVEDFTEDRMLNLKPELFPDIPNENLIDGVSLTNANLQYTFSAQTTGNLVGYVFYECLKEVTLKSGIALIS